MAELQTSGIVNERGGIEFIFLPIYKRYVWNLHEIDYCGKNDETLSASLAEIFVAAAASIAKDYPSVVNENIREERNRDKLLKKQYEECVDFNRKAKVLSVQVLDRKGNSRLVGKVANKPEHKHTLN